MCGTNMGQGGVVKGRAGKKNHMFVSFGCGGGGGGAGMGTGKGEGLNPFDARDCQSGGQRSPSSQDVAHDPLKRFLVGEAQYIG